MGILRREIEYQLRSMGFDVRDVTLRLPLQVVWTAIEGMDIRITEAQRESDLEAERLANITVRVPEVVDACGGISTRGRWKHAP